MIDERKLPEVNILYSQNIKGCHQDAILVHPIVVIENILTADLPQELNMMSEELKDSFYPYEDRPSVILSDSQGNVQMTFQIFEQELKDGDIRQAAQAVHKCTEDLYSRNQLSPVYVNCSGETPVGWFLMEMELGDTKYHHIKAVRAVQERLFLMTITYPETESLKWQAVLNHLFLTLRERSVEDAESQ